MEEYFVTQDNVLDKNIDQLIEKHEFVNRTNLAMLNKDIIDYVTFYFTEDKNLDKAKKLLEGDETRVPRSSLIIISLFGGGIIMSTLMIIFFLVQEY